MSRGCMDYFLDDLVFVSLRFEDRAQDVVAVVGSVDANFVVFARFELEISYLALACKIYRRI